MKKLFAVMLSALCLSSCSQNEHLESPTALKTTFGFSTYIGTTSKAADLLDAAFLNFEVEAYSYLATSTLATAVTTNAFETYIPLLIVKRDGTSSDWTYEGAYYWPASTSYLDFYAYSSNAVYEDEDVSGSYNSYTASYVPVSYTDESNYVTAPSLTYTAGEDITKQIDLVAASAINKIDDGSTGEVNLTFKHILARINFTVQGAAKSSTTDPYYYIVSKITLNDVPNVGTYTYSTETASTGAWTTAAEGTTDYAYFAPDSSDKYVTATDDTTAVDLGAASIMLIPQSYTGTTGDATTDPSGITIDVEYEVYQGTTLIGSYTDTAKKTVSLDAVTWAIGNNLIYNLVLPIDATKIIFTTTELEEWETAKSTDTSVPVGSDGGTEA